VLSKGGLIALFVFLFLAPACAKKKLFYFKEISPPYVQSETALQKTTGYPPLLRPKGKRKTIRPGSQYFKLAIPNAVDMSGRAQDLQQSLADMFYTELFATGRFNLLDRGELVNLDPEWLSTSLKKSIIDLTEQQNPEVKKERNNAGTSADASTMFESTFKYLDRKEDIKYELLKVLSGADGILLVYITSRVGADKGGHFYVDYRIISKPSPRSQEIVIFAASKQIKYQSSTTQEVAYSREDIRDIAKNIVSSSK